MHCADIGTVQKEVIPFSQNLEVISRLRRPKSRCVIKEQGRQQLISAVRSLNRYTKEVNTMKSVKVAYNDDMAESFR